MTQAPTTPMTAEEFYALEDDGRSLELVNGAVVEMANGGGLHGWVGRRVHLPLAHHVLTNGLGEVPLPSTGYRLGPHAVRKPDASFVRADTWPTPPPTGWLPFAPTLAVEVISPSDVWSQVEQKAQEYLRLALSAFCGRERGRSPASPRPLSVRRG